MKKLFEYNNNPVKFIKSSEVKDGVVCDVYEFVNDKSKDLGIVSVQKGCKTPLQLVLDGEKTLEIFQQGQGVLTIIDQNGDRHKYNFPSEQSEVEVKIGEKMQWEALEDLVFAEICYPPYRDGRFKDLPVDIPIMTKDEAVERIWNYMHMNHELKKADVIFVLGSHDTRVAEYAADLLLQGYAPVILFSGSGTVHKGEAEWKGFVGSTEAEIFAEIAKKKGVPENQILIENKSQNTGENFKLSLEILRQNNIPTNTLIAVQKPYMERRTYATGKIHLPETELIVTSPDIALINYNDGIHATDKWIETMVGDLLRIKHYPAKGFQIEQEIPNDVWRAYKLLVEQGYDKRPIQK